jgi:uncharacterized membrane protein YukC
MALSDYLTMSQEKFHIEKSISVGHILTTLVLIIGAFTYFTDFDKRISATEQEITFLKAQRVEDARRIEKRLDSINEKLDKILESGMR